MGQVCPYLAMILMRVIWFSCLVDLVNHVYFILVVYIITHSSDAKKAGSTDYTCRLWRLVSCWYIITMYMRCLRSWGAAASIRTQQRNDDILAEEMAFTAEEDHSGTLWMLALVDSSPNLVEFPPPINSAPFTTVHASSPHSCSRWLKNEKGYFVWMSTP